MESSIRKTILLVEDDAILAMATKANLEQMGYIVLTAASGEKAIAIARENPGLDLILMDIDLGRGIDGTEAAAAILKGKEIPIVFLSSHTEPEIVEKTEKITSYGYVVKNSGKTILDASIKMAFKLFAARLEQKRSEGKFRDLFQHMIEGVALHELVVDEEGRAVDYVILDTNEAFGAHLGISKSAVIGKTARQAYGVTEAPYLEAYAKVALTGEPTTFETYFPAMNKYFTISAYRPSPGQFATIFEDITERKRTEESLKASEERLRNTIDRSGAGYFFIDSDGIFRAVNNAWLRLHKYDSEGEVLGKHFSLTQVNEDRDKANEIVQSLLRDRVVVSGEFERKCRDGTIGRHRYSINSVWRDGEPVGLEGFLIDMPQAKVDEAPSHQEDKLKIILSHKSELNEKRLQLLVDILQHPSDSIQEFLDYALDQALLMTGSKFGYIYFYDEARREFILNTWSRGVMEECKVVNPQTRYELDKTGIWGEAVRQRRPIIINEFAAPNQLKKGYPEGHVALLRFLTLPIFKDESIVATIGLANKEKAYDQSDILQSSLLMDAVWKVTERIRAEMEVKRLLDEKDLMLRETHHRLKNNMTGIASILALQRMDTGDETTKRALQDAESRIQSMVELYTKLYQSATYKSISILDYLPDMIDEIVRTFSSGTAIKVEKHIEDIILDAKRMQPLGIIVNELIVNIMKYAFSGRAEGSIAVSARGDDGFLILTIKDDGIGLPESVDLGHTTGFGLNLVQNLMEQLGGKIRLERGDGTTLVLELPLE